MIPIKELVCNIIDKFENILDENDITIPDPDRDEDNENEARIFGQTYYRLEEEITDVIKESGIIQPVEFD